MRKADLEPLLLAQFDQSIENRLPVLVAGEIVVRDEEARDVLSGVLPDDAFDVVGAPIARLAALNVDDGAERTLERTAAARVEGRQDAVVATNEAARQIGDGLLLQVWQVVHGVVDRPRRAAVDVLQEPREVFFRLARIEHNAEVERLLEFGGQLFQHGHAAADMEPADRNRDALRPKLARDRHGAGKLIRLDADKADDARMVRSVYALGDSLDGNLDVHVVVGVHLDRNVLAQHVLIRAVLGNGVERRHGIGRNPSLPPLNDIAVFVIMRRLYDLDMKCLHEPNLAPRHSSQSNAVACR